MDGGPRWWSIHPSLSPISDSTLRRPPLYSSHAVSRCTISPHHAEEASALPTSAFCFSLPSVQASSSASVPVSPPTDKGDEKYSVRRKTMCIADQNRSSPPSAGTRPGPRQVSVEVMSPATSAVPRCVPRHYPVQKTQLFSIVSGYLVSVPCAPRGAFVLRFGAGCG